MSFTENQTARIRLLNDILRETMMGGQVVFTQGVRSLPTDQIAIAMRMVREFNAFTKDNDPHGEHDFGAFNVYGQKLLWKIDCYDKSMQHGSDDPSDIGKTSRVLTIMLASEY